MFTTNLFFFSIIISLLMVSTCVSLSNNRVFAALFLIISYIFVSILLFMLHVEFIALVILITYAGAVLVFFLFVVIMLGNINYKKLDIIPCIFGLVLLFLFYFVSVLLIKGYSYNIESVKVVDSTVIKSVAIDFYSLNSYIYNELLNEKFLFHSFIDIINILNFNIENIFMLKVSIMYKNNLGTLMGCGLLLFIAIFGCIVILLSIRNKKIKRQESIDQTLKLLRN